MVRMLTSTLATAVSEQTRRPALTLSAEDHIVHLAQSIAPGGADLLNDACLAADGALIRVQLTNGANPFQQSFQWQRITDPTQTAQWQTWNTFGGGAGNMFSASFCAVSNNGSNGIRAFAQRGTGGNDLWHWFSLNNGVTWSSAPATILVPPGGALIKGIASSGNNEVFFMYDVLGGEAIGASFYTGSWSALNTWTLPTIANGAGLDVAFLSNLFYILYSDGYALHLCTSTSNGSTWNALPDIAPATSSAIGQSSPHLSYFDGLYQLIAIESDHGLLTSNPYNYPRLRQSADLLHWSSGLILHDMTTLQGAVYLKSTFPSTTRARYVAASGATVMLSQDYQPTDSSMHANLSASIIEYTRTDEIDKPATLTITLDNNQAQLQPSIANYGITYAPLGFNTSLVLSEGYLTGTPPLTREVIQIGTYHVQQIMFERAPGKNQVKVIARDISRNLDLINRYQVVYSNQTVSWLISEVCARAGLFKLALPSTAQMSQQIPGMILHAGQTYRRALDELCRLYWLEYFLDQNEQLIFRERSGSDPSIWSYTPEIETLELSSDEFVGNHVLVVGKPPASGLISAVTNGEAYDDLNVHVIGLERLLMTSDPRLTTASACLSKAGFLLAQEQHSRTMHTITVPVNPALQLLDVLTINDQPVGNGTGMSSTCRIVKGQVTFNQEKGIYTLRIELEGLL